MHSSTLRGGSHVTRDVTYYTTFQPSLAAVNDLSSSPAEAGPEPAVTPPIDASSFDYVLRLDNLSSVRQLWADDPAFMPTAVVYGLAFVFGFLGNLFVALALLVDRRQRAVLAASDGGAGGHHLTTSFLVSLAVARDFFSRRVKISRPRARFTKYLTIIL